MRVGLYSRNPAIQLAQALNLLPSPLLETQVAFVVARAIQAAVELGIFDALEQGPLTAADIASSCNTHPAATQNLLLCLVGTGYLDHRPGTATYALNRMSRKWLVRSSPESVADKLLFQQHEWDLISRTEEYVRTGKSVDFHHSEDETVWLRYQRAMRVTARTDAKRIAAQMPLPKGARDLLDLGGATGAYAAAFLRKMPSLRAVVLDLPEAVKQSAALLAEEGLGERLRHQEANLLEADLGSETYDAVWMSMVAHHLSEEQNRDLAKKVARALRAGGIFMVRDIERMTKPTPGDQLAGMTALYFGLTSQSGSWSVAEISSWQAAAGLQPVTTWRSLLSFGTIVIAKKM